MMILKIYIGLGYQFFVAWLFREITVVAVTRRRTGELPRLCRYDYVGACIAMLIAWPCFVFFVIHDVRKTWAEEEKR